MISISNRPAETPVWHHPPEPPKLAPHPDVLDRLDPELPPLLAAFDKARAAALEALRALDGAADFHRALTDDDIAQAVTTLAADWPNRLGRSWAAHQAALIAEQAVTTHARTVTYKLAYQTLMDLESQLLEQVGKVGNFAQADEPGQLILSQVRSRIVTTWRPLRALVTWCIQPHSPTPSDTPHLWPGWWVDVQRQITHEPESAPVARMDDFYNINRRARPPVATSTTSADRANRRVGYRNGGRL